MSVRKRSWVTAAGTRSEAWVVDYVDQAGKRHLRTFDKKKIADAFHDTVRTEVRDGTHTADRDSITVAEAGKLWLATGDQYGLERSTIAEYRRILKSLHHPGPGTHQVVPAQRADGAIAPKKADGWDGRERRSPIAVAGTQNQNQPWNAIGRCPGEWASSPQCSSGLKT